MITPEQTRRRIDDEVVEVKVNLLHLQEAIRMKPLTYTQLQMLRDSAHLIFKAARRLENHLDLVLEQRGRK